jgi:hypothetical protein
VLVPFNKPPAPPPPEYERPPAPPPATTKYSIGIAAFGVTELLAALSGPVPAILIALTLNV